MSRRIRRSLAELSGAARLEAALGLLEVEDRVHAVAELLVGAPDLEVGERDLGSSASARRQAAIASAPRPSSRSQLAAPEGEARVVRLLLLRLPRASATAAREVARPAPARSAARERGAAHRVSGAGCSAGQRRAPAVEHAREPHLERRGSAARSAGSACPATVVCARALDGRVEPRLDAAGGSTGRAGSSKPRSRLLLGGQALEERGHAARVEAGAHQEHGADLVRLGLELAGVGELEARG